MNESEGYLNDLLVDLDKEEAAVPSEGAEMVGVAERRWGGPGRNRVEAKEFAPSAEAAPLFNNESLPTNFGKVYKFEKPEHRIIAYLKAQGLNNKEIAERTGLCYATICNVVRLPWVREIVLLEIQKNGRDAVQALLREETIPSLLTLVEIRDNDKAAARDRASAADRILDRALGKASQPITVTEKVDLDSLSDAELASIATSGRN